MELRDPGPESPPHSLHPIVGFLCPTWWVTAAPDELISAASGSIFWPSSRKGKRWAGAPCPLLRPELPVITSVLPVGPDRRQSRREAALFLGGTGLFPVPHPRGGEGVTCCPLQSPIPERGFLSFGRLKEAPRCGEYLSILPAPPSWPPALKKHLWALLLFASSSLAQSFPNMARLFHLARLHFPCPLFLEFCLLLALEHGKCWWPPWTQLPVRASVSAGGKPPRPAFQGGSGLRKAGW